MTLLKKALGEALAAAPKTEAAPPDINFSKMLGQVQRDYETAPAKGLVHACRRMLSRTDGEHVMEKQRTGATHFG